ncbi:MAG: FtsX-like permease family protein [Planctomycetota bacterium]
MAIKIGVAGGCKMDPEMVIVHGIDKEKFLHFRKYNIEPDALRRFREDKTSVLAGMSIARRKGWLAGQQINPLQEEKSDKTFYLAGIFFTGNEEQDNYVLADFKYIQDIYDKRGWCNLIYVKVKEGVDPQALATQIDNEPFPVRTRTQPEKAFLSSMLDELGGVVGFSKLVILITLLVMLIGIANTISMSIRDRTRQIGVLRTLGYTRPRILSLILLESVIMSIIGGALGCLAVFAIFRLFGVSIQILTYRFSISLDASVVIMSMGIAVLVGIIGSLAPAYRASRLNIVNSLRNFA